MERTANQLKKEEEQIKQEFQNLVKKSGTNICYTIWDKNVGQLQLKIRGEDPMTYGKSSLAILIFCLLDPKEELVGLTRVAAQSLV